MNSHIDQLNWRSEDCNEAAAQMAWTLRAICAEAPFVREIAIIRTKQHNGEMLLEALYLEVKNSHMSRSLVKQIILATGEFEVLEAEGKIRFTEQGFQLFETRKQEKAVRKSSHCSAKQGEDSRTAFSANAHASSSTKQEREKENNLPSFACERPDWPEMPEELADYEQETWFDEVCTLFDQDQMEQWRDTLMMQHPDKELTGLMERHWAETVMQFVFHLVTWPPSKGIWSLNDMKRAFHNFVRDNRTPSRQLKALLRQLELQQTECDEREQRFHGYMQEHFPHLQQMPDALSFEQFDALRRHYGKAAVLTVLTDMENDTTLEKRSCYETARGWLGHRKTGNNGPKAPFPDPPPRRGWRE